jgi:hypothetical protein
MKMEKRCGEYEEKFRTLEKGMMVMRTKIEECVSRLQTIDVEHNKQKKMLGFCYYACKYLVEEGKVPSKGNLSYIVNLETGVRNYGHGSQTLTVSTELGFTDGGGTMDLTYTPPDFIKHLLIMPRKDDHLSLIDL